MLAVSKLVPGQEAYYERSVAVGLDEYYAGHGESPGVWAGTGAAGLELSGVVGEGELGRLIGARHPATAALLRRHARPRSVQVERLDPASGELRRVTRTLAPVAGYDLVFSAPKSVSLLHALGDERQRFLVGQAHLAAWQAALAYLEAEACVVRRGKNGIVRERGSGFVAAAYQHRTSRALEPQLHTHVLVGNLAQGADGHWRALDGELLLKTHRVAAGALYQAQLRHELSQTLGVRWREAAQGMAEIEGIPDAVLRAFSSRRAQLLEHLERSGGSGFYASRVAAVATRESKTTANLAELREQWRARAEEHGLTRDAFERLGDSPSRPRVKLQVNEAAARLAGPDGLTARQTTFTGPDAIVAWASALRDGAPARDVVELTRQFLAVDAVEPIDREPAALGRASRYTTRELLEAERAALAVVERGRNRLAAVADADAERAVLAGGLARDQATAARAVLASRDRVVCLVGPAGAGKTTTTRTLAAAFSDEGVRVLGAAPSGVAADRLRDELALPAGTLHQLLRHAERYDGLPRGCVVVIDEAGMADTRTLGQVLREIERADGRAILIGDPAQLPAVGAGGLFAAIGERHGATTLTTSRRQHDELERRALDALRAGDSAPYLAHATRKGQLVHCEDALDAKARLLGDWWSTAKADVASNVMIAHRRRDVRELNRVARAVMRAEGRLGQHELPLPDGSAVAAGDRIVCLRNDRALGVSNGTRATIEAVDPGRRELLLATDEGRLVPVPTRYVDAGHIQHAYALTGHKTQGLTFEHAFVLAPTHAHAAKEWGYVALSRARQRTLVYLADPESAAEPDRHPQWQPERPEPVERLADALRRPAAEALASQAAALDPRERLGARIGELRDRQRALTSREVRERHALREAEREIAELSPLARLRHAARVRDAIRECGAAVQATRRELGDVEHELAAVRRRLHQVARGSGRSTEVARANARAREAGPELGR